MDYLRYVDQKNPPLPQPRVLSLIDIQTYPSDISERTLAIPFDWNPKGGTEVCDQWVVAALKMPVNGSYECRIRVRSEANALDTMYFDDIRVVES